LTLAYVYDAAYLDWQLGKGHPTNPARAAYCMEFMKALDVDFRVVKPRLAEETELSLAHGPEYVERTLNGYNDEWDGRNLRLARTARLMAGGTMTGVDLILNGDADGPVTRVFNPQGAKHHAMRNAGSGFCVFNDMVMAAHRFVRAGRKVAYLDWDVHHGDGVQAGVSRIGQDSHGAYGARTFSVFGHGFAEPSTLMYGMDGQHVHACLEDGSGNRTWLEAIDRFCDEIEDYRPDVILLATGADSHVTDPLGPLTVTAEGYEQAGQMVNDLAVALDVPVLVGGAGGYQPYTWTPMCWALVAAALAA
jgi:acetoin utilization protein AcuC